MPTEPKKPSSTAPREGGGSRQERLAKALRDNLRKRKAQQRAQEHKRQEGQGSRTAAAPDSGPEGDGGDAS